MRREAIKSADEVFSILGPGYGEKVYQTALSHEMRLRGVPHQREHNIQLLYKKHELGMISVDFLVGDDTIVECKAVKTIKESHKKQVRAYALSLGLEGGTLINFHKEEDELEVFEVGVEGVEFEKPSTAVKGRVVDRIKESAEEVANILGAEFFYQPDASYYYDALKLEFRMRDVPYTVREFELLYKEHIVETESYFVIENKYLLDVISKGEIDEDLVKEYQWEWGVTGFKSGILINIQPDTAKLELARVGL